MEEQAADATPAGRNAVDWGRDGGSMRKAVVMQAYADGLADWRNSPLMSNEKVKGQSRFLELFWGNLKVARPLPPARWQSAR